MKDYIFGQDAVHVMIAIGNAGNNYFPIRLECIGLGNITGILNGSLSSVLFVKNDFNTTFK